MTQTVLTVDDNALFSTMYSALFGSMGCRVFCAGSKAEALRLLEREAPDLILMDIRLPDGSGVDAIRAIRALPGFSDKPIITVSARALGPDGDAARAAGSTELMAKPVCMSELASVTRRHLGALAA